MGSRIQIFTSKMAYFFLIKIDIDTGPRPEYIFHSDMRFCQTESPHPSPRARLYPHMKINAKPIAAICLDAILFLVFTFCVYLIVLLCLLRDLLLYDVK